MEVDLEGDTDTVGVRNRDNGAFDIASRIVGVEELFVGQSRGINHSGRVVFNDGGISEETCDGTCAVARSLRGGNAESNHESWKGFREVHCGGLEYELELDFVDGRALYALWIAVFKVLGSFVR